MQISRISFVNFQAKAPINKSVAEKAVKDAAKEVTADFNQYAYSTPTGESAVERINQVAKEQAEQKEKRIQGYFPFGTNVENGNKDLPSKYPYISESTIIQKAQ